MTVAAAIVVLLWLSLAVFPFLWTLWGSFKLEPDFLSRTDWRSALFGPFTKQQTGSALTGLNYHGAWVERGFWRAALNTAVVTASVVMLSLAMGTLGAYALARSGFRYAYWLLIAALVFRAMPHVTLVSGYLLPLFELQLWGTLPTTILVLVAVNQPFTLWMLHAFFLNVPREIDDSAQIDGCTPFQAFRLTVLPLMWPGIITTGLFSFLLAYNDFTITSLLLSQHNQTMVPAVASFLGTTQSEGKAMYAVAAVVCSVLPLCILVLLFQRRFVSGLVTGAIKG